MPLDIVPCQVSDKLDSQIIRADLLLVCQPADCTPERFEVVVSMHRAAVHQPERAWLRGSSVYGPRGGIWIEAVCDGDSIGRRKSIGVSERGSHLRGDRDDLRC